MARPSKLTPAMSDRICSRIAAGESLVKICRDSKMPGRSTVMHWILTDNEFRDKYAHAKELCAEVFADEIIEIADDGTNDTYEDDKGNEKIDYDVIARSKLRVDARKWAASKLAPKKYGEKLQQEITGKDGAPLAAPVTQVMLSPEKLEEVARRLSDEV